MVNKTFPLGKVVKPNIIISVLFFSFFSSFLPSLLPLSLSPPLPLPFPSLLPLQTTDSVVYLPHKVWRKVPRSIQVEAPSTLAK